MKRRLTIQPEAVGEVNDAFNWYEDRQPGLGHEFYRELTRCLEFVLEHPQTSRVAYRRLRKRKLDRFPYLVVYPESELEVTVVSIFHGSRNPAAWRRRA
jgi:plasmid stabilization system protein ParE